MVSFTADTNNAPQRLRIAYWPWIINFRRRLMIVVIFSRNNQIDRSRVIEIAPTSAPHDRGWRKLALLCIWVALIFGTSCTVIRPSEFFDLLARFTGAKQASMERFALFWGFSWFAIVKGWHFTEFLILTLLTASVIKLWCSVINDWFILGSMLLCIAFAVSDEWHQSFVPDRFGTVQDVLIDCLGVCVAGSILLLRQRQTIAANHAPHRIDVGKRN